MTGLTAHERQLLRPSDEERVLRRARREIASELRVLIECSTIADKRGRTRMDSLDKLAKPHVKRKQSIIAAIDRVLK